MKNDMKLKKTNAVCDEKSPDIKMKIVCSINFAILFMGVIMFCLGNAFNVVEHSCNDRRIIIGAILVFVWFATFPFISRENKEKFITNLSVYYVGLIICIFIAYGCLKYLIENLTKGNLLGDVLLCLGGICIIAYMLYIFISFLQTFFWFVKRLTIFIFPRMEGKVSGFKNVLEGLTALFITITAFSSSILAVIEIFKKIIF